MPLPAIHGTCNVQYSECVMPVTEAKLEQQEATATVPAEADEVEYPDHLWAKQSLRHQAAGRFATNALEQHFDACNDVLVASEFVLYYRRGDNQSALQPDVQVAFGVPSARARSADEGRVYKLWEEGKVPDFVLEVASPSTAKRDAGPKALLYAAIGVREYWRLDPEGTLMERALEGYRWQAGRYEPVASVERDGSETLRSEVLGLDLCAAHQDGSTFLVFRDPQTGEEFDGRPEVAEQRRRLAEIEARAAREEAQELKRQIRELKGQDSSMGRDF